MVKFKYILTTALKGGELANRKQKKEKAKEEYAKAKEAGDEEKMVSCLVFYMRYIFDNE